MYHDLPPYACGVLPIAPCLNAKPYAQWSGRPRGVFRSSRIENLSPRKSPPLLVGLILLTRGSQLNVLNK